MGNVSYGSTFDGFISYAQIIVTFFKSFFDILNTNLWSFIGGPDSSLPSWLITALDTVNADAFLSQFTLFGLLFSLIIVAILVAYFFIP